MSCLIISTAVINTICISELGIYVAKNECGLILNYVEPKHTLNWVGAEGEKFQGMPIFFIFLHFYASISKKIPISVGPGGPEPSTGPQGREGLSPCRPSI